MNINRVITIDIYLIGNINDKIAFDVRQILHKVTQLFTDTFSTLQREIIVKILTVYHIPYKLLILYDSRDSFTSPSIGLPAISSIGMGSKASTSQSTFIGVDVTCKRQHNS